MKFFTSRENTNTVVSWDQTVVLLDGRQPTSDI